MLKRLGTNILFLLVAMVLIHSLSASPSSFSSTSSSPFAFAASTDATVVQLLRFFDGVTNKDPTWTTGNKVTDWNCNGTKCCSIDTSNLYSCEFDYLDGKLSLANSFSDLAIPLRSLRFDQYSRRNEKSRLGGAVDFSNFPTALRSLEFSWVDLRGSVNIDLALLSRQLTTFIVRVANLQPMPMNLLDMPPSMYWFDVNDNEFSGHLDVSKLPRSLGGFEIRGNKFEGTVNMSEVPPKLVNFDVYNNPKLIVPVDLAALPRTIRTIRVGSQPSWGNVSLSLLPRNITHVWLRNNRNYSGEISLDDLPPRLETLRLDGCSYNSTQLNFDRLPQTLEELEIDRNKFSPQDVVDLSKIPNRLNELTISSNSFDGEIILPDAGNGLRTLRFDSCNVSGIIDGKNLSRSLAFLNAGNNRLTQLDNWNDFPGSLEEVHLHRNNLKGTVSMATASRKLTRLYLADNQLNSSDFCNLTLAPPKLIKIWASNNRLSGPLDWRSSPKTLDEVDISRNDCYGPIMGFPAGAGKNLTRFLAHTNRINGTLNLTNIPLALATIALYSNRFTHLVFGNLTNHQQLKTLYLHSNSIGNYVLDLRGAFPLGLTDFYLATNLIQKIVVSVDDVPLVFRTNFYREFCYRIVSGNHRLRSMELCNISATKSMSKSVSLSSHPTASVTVSMSDSSVDAVRDWMLRVVLYQVTNIPQQWRLAALDKWVCPSISSGPQQQQQQQQRLCCPISNASSRLYSCSFEGLVGRVRVDFPRDYPLERFSIATSPSVQGVVSLDLMPTALRSLAISDTRVAPSSSSVLAGSSSIRLGALANLQRFENLTLCSNRGFDGVVTNVDASSLPANLLHLSLCGGTLRGPTLVASANSSFLSNLRSLASRLRSLDLSDNELDGEAVAWSSLPSGSLESLDLSANKLGGPIATSDLPRSLRLLNVSHNAGFVGAPDWSKLPSSLRVFDASNNRLNGTSPNFNLLTSSTPNLVYFSIKQNLFGGALASSSIDSLPRSLTTFDVSSNRFEGDFEVRPSTSVLPPALAADVRRFCLGVIPGNRFRASFTCGLTLTKTVSRSAPSPSRGTSSFSEPNASLSSSFSESRRRTPTHEASATWSSSKPTPTGATPSLSRSIDVSRTHTALESLSRRPTTSESGSSSMSPSAELPWYPFVRQPALTAVLLGGAGAAALTPTASAAALIVSRQTAVARAFGGSDGECGGPTRSDPLAFFEDPLKLDFAPDSCMGQLAGIYVGNLVVGCALVILTFTGHAVHSSYARRRLLHRRLTKRKDVYERKTGRALDVDAIVARKMPWFRVLFSCPPSLLAGFESGWPLEVLSVFGFGFLFPPAISALLVGAVRCESDWAGAVGALSIVVAALALHRLLFARQRHEKFVRVRAVVPRRARCWLLLSLINVAFAPCGVWEWLPGGAHSDPSKKRSALVRRSQKLLLKNRKHCPQTEFCAAPSSVAAATGQSARADSVDEGGGHDSSSPPPASSLPASVAAAAAAAAMEVSRLRFLAVSRWLDKYVKRSWWFIAFELGVRAVMTLAPAIAEAVPRRHSCVVLRSIYLLAVNALMIAVWSRKPYVHRALLWATCVATMAEIIVLVLLIVTESAADVAAPALLIVAQIFAITCSVGVELYMWVGEYFFPWVFDKPAQREQDEEAGGAGDGAGASAASKNKNKNNSNQQQQQGATESEELGDFAQDLGDEELLMQLLSEDQVAALDVANAAIELGDSDRGLVEEDDDNDDDDEDHDLKEYIAAAELELAAQTNASPNARLVRLADLAVRDNEGDEEMDLFDRLDRRMRRAYAELVHEDLDIVPKHQKYQHAREEFDEFVNI